VDHFSRYAVPEFSDEEDEEEEEEEEEGGDAEGEGFGGVAPSKAAAVQEEDRHGTGARGWVGVLRREKTNPSVLCVCAELMPRHLTHLTNQHLS
jgi:hypothetical protein